MIKVALSGKKGSGKSTVAEYLSDTFGFDVFSFADGLKMDLENIGINPDRLYKDKDETARKLMQLYGQAMSEQNARHWVDQVLGGIEILEECCSEAVVIDDLRFKNEKDVLEDEGFVTIRVIKAGNDDGDNDLSETELDDETFDYTIFADPGDLQSLFHNVDVIIGELSS